MSVPKQKFTADFKQEAVRLVHTTGKSCAQIARDLGGSPHYVVRWKQQQDAHRDEVIRDVLWGRLTEAQRLRSVQLILREFSVSKKGLA